MFNPGRFWDDKQIHNIGQSLRSENIIGCPKLEKSMRLLRSGLYEPPLRVLSDSIREINKMKWRLHNVEQSSNSKCNLSPHCGKIEIVKLCDSHL